MRVVISQIRDNIASDVTHIRDDGGACKHCGVPIIKYPDILPDWLHNPGRGFRLSRCRGLATVAEPNEHGRAQMENWESKVRCLCGEQFATRREFSEHIAAHASDRQPVD